MNVMPDPLALLRSYLLTVDEVTALVEDRISSRTPEQRVYPLVRLNIVPGGTQTVRERIQRTLVDVHYYADPSGDSPELAAGNGARVIHAAILDAGGYVTSDAVILDTTEILGPFDLPDVGERDEPLDRYLSTVVVHSRPNP